MCAQCPNGAGEARQTIRIFRNRWQQDLDRDVAIQLRGAGAIDLAHPADAERRADLVGAEPSAGWEGHAWPILAIGWGPAKEKPNRESGYTFQ